MIKESERSSSTGGEAESVTSSAMRMGEEEEERPKNLLTQSLEHIRESGAVRCCDDLLAGNAPDSGVQKVDL